MSSLQQLLQFSNECLQIQVALQLYGAIFMCVLQLCHAIVIDGLKLDVCVITLQLMVRQVTFGPCTYTDPQSCKVAGLQEPPRSIPRLHPVFEGEFCPRQDCLWAVCIATA